MPPAMRSAGKTDWPSQRSRSWPNSTMATRMAVATSTAFAAIRRRFFAGSRAVMAA